MKEEELGADMPTLKVTGKPSFCTILAYCKAGMWILRHRTLALAYLKRTAEHGRRILDYILIRKGDHAQPLLVSDNQSLA